MDSTAHHPQLVLNPHRGSIELRFPARPDDRVLDALKRHGFSWSPGQQLWYAGHSAPCAQLARSLVSRTGRFNRILHGDCIPLMAGYPDHCVDLVVTDPPYLVAYRDRQGRRIANDDNDAWLKPAFQEIARLMKPDTYCVSFYGWNHVESFMAAWKQAGLVPVGHIVWHKDYPSRRGHLSARHEMAYLLAKGRPAKPVAPLPDVQPWTYSGNRLHPTQKSVSVIEPLITAFSRPGAVVFDPFAGSGTTAVAARHTGRQYLAMELDAAFCRIARDRLALP